MKNNKMITLDVKLIEKLQETKNVSKLIEGLLMDYFYGGGGLEEEEMKLKIKELQQEIERDTEKILLIKDKLSKVKVKKEEVQKKFNKVPEHILDDFRQFPMMTEEALVTRYAEYKGEDWESIKAAYKEYFNK